MQNYEEKNPIDLNQLSHQIGLWYLSEGLSCPSENALLNIAESWAHTLISIKPSHIIACFFYGKREGGRPSASHMLKVYAKQKDEIEYLEIQNDPNAKKQLSQKTTAQHEWDLNHFETIKENWTQWIKDGLIQYKHLNEIGITEEMVAIKFQDYYHFKTYKPLNFEIMDVNW